MWVLEQHTVFVLHHGGHFFETVDIELPDEGGEVFEFEEMLEDLIIDSLFGLAYCYLLVIPTYVLTVLWLLHEGDLPGGCSRV